ncbi:metal dependent phosphohydrolase [Candidatus Gastranaerophilus sp. (ex Termes propinquus)]|nr:metal dependent phosphohydrolase [Candidatus Gastranaerophilus sp. (ex Termes propinquus)]
MDNKTETIQTYLDEFKEIPPMPNVMVKALEVIKNPHTGLKELANIMSADQAISTKTLSLVNSAFYGFRQQVTSINKALVILGMMKAKNIIMSLALRQMMVSQGSRELWEHSIRCAIAAEHLASELKVINPDDAFIMGFLHDIGKILLNAKDPAKYSKVRFMVQQEDAEICALETEHFGTDHCMLGSMISKKWQLPVILTNCIKYHHQPTLSSLPAACGIVYVADRLVQLNSQDPVFNPEIMERLDFRINDPKTIREHVLNKANVFIKEMSPN